jgi:hypothetical protein
VRQIHYTNTELIFERACELREFGDKGDISWREWYNWNAEQTGHSAGELEQAVAEELNIPFPARNGFAVTGIDHETFIITDLEECGTCDLSDADDKHHVMPVTQFREWLYKWNAEPLNKVMDTTEAAAIWGYSSPDAVKRLCREGKVKCRKMTNGSYLIDRNQASPRTLR